MHIPTLIDINDELISIFCEPRANGMEHLHREKLFLSYLFNLQIGVQQPEIETNVNRK